MLIKDSKSFSCIEPTQLQLFYLTFIFKFQHAYSVALHNSTATTQTSVIK